MSIFGSREDDPLLQDDPFAPSSGDGAPEQNGASSKEPTDNHASNHGPPSGSPAQESKSTATDDSLGGSVFDPSTNADGRSFGETDRTASEASSREIVRTAEQAANGHLSTINDALDAGWRLRRVELRNASADHAQADADRSFAFILRRSSS